MILLNSKITKAILEYFFLHEKNKLYLNEIVERLRLDKRNLVKKLKELQREGLFSMVRRGNLTYYFLNKKYPLYKEYQKIILKTFGIENKLRNTLKEVEKISEAYIIGSYAKNRMDISSDVDVLVIGEADTIRLQERIQKLQKQIDREINLVIIGRKELEKRKKKKDAFIKEVFSDSRIKLV